MLKITTPCFVEGGWIPDYNAGFGEDQSPEFHIEGIDTKAETMVITLDDLGHPLEPGYNHWVAWNITPAECIPGGIAKGSVVEMRKEKHMTQAELATKIKVTDSWYQPTFGSEASEQE